jgi:hypothetical protein
MMYRVLFLIGLFTSSLGFSASVICPGNRCMAVVDAGNTASKLQIYSYDMDPSNTPVKIKKVFSKKIEPGFASINLNQKSIDQYLSLLFSDVPDLNIPVYFYATSGMRKLSFARQQTYYAKLNQWFSMQSQWKLVVAKTLKSREEALYGWLAVNYELGRLSSPSAPLVGVVDTGSASVQIAFPVKHVQDINPNDYMNIDLYGRHVSLFTHGFLGLGQDEIRSQYLDSGVCFPKHYPLANGSSAVGDFQSCEKLMAPLINDIHQVDNTVKAAIQNNPEQTWYIIGGLSAMLQEKPFTFGHHEFTNEDVAKKANRQICQQDWSILGTIYPENKYIYAACLNASYFYSLFVEGFGIDKNQPIHYISNKTSTNSWSLGVVLCQDGRLCSIA